MFRSSLIFFSTAVVVLLLRPIPSRAATSDPGKTEVWTIERLDLDVEIVPSAKKLLVTGRMTVRLQEVTSKRIAFVLNARKKAMRYRSLSAKGVSASFFRYKPDLPVEVALVELPEVFERGESLEVEFSTESETESDQLMIREGGALASWVENWYPVPATVEHGMVSPAASGSMTFRMPRGWRAVSNGKLIRRSTVNRGVEERWESDIPVARSFAAARYLAQSLTSGSRTIAFYLLRARPTGASQAAALSRALKAMEQRFGPYPYASYNVAEVEEGVSFAAASEQGFIMVRSSVLDDARGSLPLFAHEAAHGWWGNLVRSDGPGGRMLTEALAQYGAVISIEAIEGKQAADEFLRFSREGYNPLQCALGYFHIWREGGDNPLSKLESGRWDHSLADSKGMWFYHMLRRRVGNEIFFSTLRSLIRAFTGKQIRLEDLRNRFLLTAKDPSLEQFLAQWLDRTGAPVLRADWWSIDRGKGIEIHLDQLQSGDPFRVQLEVAIDIASGSTIKHLVELTSRSQWFTVATSSRPLQLRLDPSHRLLMWRPEYGPRPEPGPAAAREAE